MINTSCKLSINGKPAAWTSVIWALWWKKMEGYDLKTKPVTAINYFMPRPYVDEYNRGSNRAGFVYTLGDRDVCIVQWQEGELPTPPKDDPIAEYYRNKRKAGAAAWQLYIDAKASGVTGAALSKLEQAAIDAGDCGD